ncbi:hypothetical protein [Planococcus salinus]|uniref:Uncharacterized protein n=1 Tax=Planococcus salinus TaxID=1848460 RepID=A0A3M8PEN7_9BACL|nr:hypothetical protein [Planococcus salinus]RNF41250.1 hypothetical protein EEX84_02575 [Planococcus salinus]
MSMKPFKGSSMVMKMTQALMKDGWSFIPDEFDVIVRAENKKTGEAVSFPSIGNLKTWLYEKALSTPN